MVGLPGCSILQFVGMLFDEIHISVSGHQTSSGAQYSLSRFSEFLRFLGLLY